MKTASAPPVLSAKLAALRAAAGKAGALFSARYPLLVAIVAGYRKTTLLAAAGGALLLYAGVYLGAVLTADNLLTVHDTIVGGDFIVFWTAAQSLTTDNPLAAYDSAVMEAMLLENFPGRDGYNLTWQYPPTMFLVIAPFAALGYVPALWAWGAGTAAMLATVLVRFWRNYAALLIAFASAAMFQALITGQTGFFTAALIAAAAGFADRRPLLAGLAAGLLTVKPQFGLLIPVAFAAAGCWRAFGAAAATCAALAALSLVLIGPESWLAFKDAVTSHGGLMSTDVFPYHKLVTALGFLTLAGAPAGVAMGGQAAGALALAGFVFYVWRRTEEWDLRAMALIAAAPLATPYAFYYELTIFIPALFLLARRGMENGWLPWERPALALLWTLPLFTPGDKNSMLAFLIAAGAFALCARHVIAAMNAEAPDGPRTGGARPAAA